MKHNRNSLLCLLASFVSCAGAMTVDSPHNPYQAIIVRNVFALKIPPPLEPPNPEDTKPLPKIRLTGIVTGFPPGNKRAFMMETVPPKPGSPANEVSLMLTEGQSEGDVKVIEIDEKAGQVKISQNGNVIALNLPKPPNSPSAAAPATAGVLNPVGFTRSPAPAPALEAPQTDAESYIRTELYREDLQKHGNPMHKLLPPTPLNPTANTAQDPEVQNGNPGVPVLPTPPVRRR